MPLNASQRKQLVDQLIGNCSCQGKKPWKEENRETLNSLDDDTLLSLNEYQVSAQEAEIVANQALSQFEFDPEQGAFVNNAIPPQFMKDDEEEEEDTDEEEDEEEEDEEEEETTENSQHKSKRNSMKKNKVTTNQRPMTDEEWLESAPPRIQSLIINALQKEEEERNQLIETITANESNEFPEEVLTNTDTASLRALAKLAQKPVTRNFRLPARFDGASVPTTNQVADSEDDLLVVPTINWSELASSKN